MSDILVIHLRKVLEVSSMLDVPGPPHKLYVTGPDVAQVTDVEVNGIRGYSWEITANRTIAISLPPVFAARSVAILGAELGSAKEAEIQIGFGKILGEATGMQALVQYWLKCFLSTPNTDAYNKKWGGGALSFLKASSAEGGVISSGLAVAVQRTNELIISRQAANMNIPRAERLLSAKLVRTQAMPGGDAFIVDIEIKNMTGQVVRVGASS